MEISDGDEKEPLQPKKQKHRVKLSKLCMGNIKRVTPLLYDIPLSMPINWALFW